MDAPTTTTTTTTSPGEGEPPQQSTRITDFLRHAEETRKERREQDHTSRVPVSSPTSAAAAVGDKRDSPSPPPSPPQEKPAETYLILRAMSQEGQEVSFKVKPTTPMRKVIDAYCQRMSLSPLHIRFLFDGDRIDGDSTPKSLGCEDNDILDVVLQQTGGSYDGPASLESDPYHVFTKILTEKHGCYFCSDKLDVRDMRPFVVVLDDEEWLGCACSQCCQENAKEFKTVAGETLLRFEEKQHQQ